MLFALKRLFSEVIKLPCKRLQRQKKRDGTDLWKRLASRCVCMREWNQGKIQGGGNTRRALKRLREERHQGGPLSSLLYRDVKKSEKTVISDLRK